MHISSIARSGEGRRRRRIPSRVRRILIASPALCILALGCGIITTLPMDSLREGNPAGRLFAGRHAPYRTREVIFSHEPHSFEKCTACHPNDASDREEVLAGGLPSMARCFECHDDRLASRACETCHQLERVERKPSTHDATWQRRHGREADGQEFQCRLCHTESSCQACHATRMPQSHTQRFLRSTHGRMANRDRSACSTCHQADFCQNCHSQPPPDHTPTFMTTGGHKQVARLRVRSCLTCHRFEADCSECHGG